MCGALREIPLSGGRTTPGVVRVGDTVRRPPSASSDFVRRLLQHLRDRGFEAVPLPLGTDETGREMFSYIEGEVPAELGFHEDHVLRSAAALIRRFHDLGTELLGTAAAQVGIEVVCHNDLSPCNFVFREGLPVAMIDFDVAAPGTRAHDLGYAAWLWLDFGNPEISAAEQGRRLKLFVDAYGGLEPGAVIRGVLARQQALVTEGRSQGKVEVAEWAAACLEWTRRHVSALTSAR
jgi:aminoglycoside phosphotransferase (APT) family kinase protein